MPIAKIVSGCVYFDELDEMDAWLQGNNIVVDTSDKHSGTASFKAIGDSPDAGSFFYKCLNLGVGNKVHLWHKRDGARSGEPLQKYTEQSGWRWLSIITCDPYPHDWAMHTGTIPDWFHDDEPPLQPTRVAVAYSYTGPTLSHSWVDRLVVTLSASITVTGLTPGQKVEIYRSSDNTKITEATCAGGASSVSLDVDAEDYPEQMYLKVYGTNGTTLIETTSSYEMYGGDTWAWTSGAGTLSITVDADIIYRSAAAGTPKTCNIIANLKTLAGANYPGATIYFTTTLGSLHDASDVTDANGNAHTELTSATHGIAVIMANWLGDSTVPACSAYYTVHVFYEAEAPDSDKKFQFYCQGIEYAYVVGRYTLNELGDVSDFEVEIPEWLSTITINGLVNIYRKGVKEFYGILKMPNRSLSDSPRVVLKGPDVSVLLNDRVVDTKIYSLKTPQWIIDNLLTSFPCGIASGNLGACATSLTITIETEMLAKAIPRICDLVGWKYRVNRDRTLDFAESFTGGTTAASFAEGEDILMLDRQTNYLAVENYVRMKGSGIFSTKQDGTKIQEQGLHQAPVFNKSITNQATLDSACQAYLDMKKVEEETIPAEVIDAYDPGTFGPEDYITVTSATTGLAGTYQIRKIERNLEDPNYAKIDLSNKTKEYWELDLEYRRMTKDASV